jgi:hypothetical protein
LRAREQILAALKTATMEHADNAASLVNLRPPRCFDEAPF